MGIEALKRAECCVDCKDVLMNAKTRIDTLKERRCVSCIFFLKWFELDGVIR